MSDRKIRIGIFASSHSLMKRVQVQTAKMEEQIFINTQGLDDALPLALEMVRNGVEIIISRRGTAHLLRENLSIPVLSFPHRSLDILISLKRASSHDRKILLPVFRQKISGLASVKDLFDIELVQMVYQDKATLGRALKNGLRQGCSVVIGGSVTQQFAEALGIRFVEIRTSDEDIIATIEDAKSIAQASREQKAVALRYRAIMDAASDGIIAVDQNGSITTANATAVAMLKLQEKEIVGRHVDQVIPNCLISQVLLNQKPIHDRITQVGRDSYLFNYEPVTLDGVVIGAVSSFRDIGKVMRAENVVRRSLSKGLVAKYALDDLVHASPAMRDVVNIGKQYAGTDSTILIMGETGTGKEIFVHGIHDLSQRRRQPFVSINCAALPEQLLESELFGYEEGAFTGSKRGGKAGRFEIAHKGTIFLDEIDSTPQAVQVRLLRVIQEREVMRVGGDRKIPVDVRIVAAASQDLGLAVQEGKFRSDLFFRLNVLRLQIPPLRNRKEDIPLLLDHFIRLFSQRHGLTPIALPPSYLERLMRHTWPGNVRQLRNFAERLVMNCSLRCSGDTLEVLYRELIQFGEQSIETAVPKAADTDLKARLKHHALDNERAIILEALEQCRFQKKHAAERLGISRTTLWRKMRELDIA
jgi:transcriptional regulator, propionate catabolism operon regulatory protein